MSKFKPSPEQQASIDARKSGKNVTVSASAGAGKTGALIELLYTMIAKDGVSVRNILAMTFTEAAAKEMKTRLHARLEEALRDNEGDTERIRKELTLLPSADVCTIDSFCAKILKNYSYVLGWDPVRFTRVVTDRALEEIKQQAVSLVMRKNAAHPSRAFLELVMTSGKSGNDVSSLADTVLGIAAKRANYRNPDVWEKNIRSFYAAESLEDLPEEFRNELQKRIELTIEGWLDLYKKLTGILERFEVTKLLDYYAQEYVLVNGLEDRIQKGDFAGAAEYFEAEEANLPKTPQMPRGVMDPDEKKQYDKVRDKFNARYSDLKEYVRETAVLIKKNAKAKDRVYALLDCVNQYEEEFARLKEENNVIDFSDMGAGALKILRDPSNGSAEVLRKQYDYILVDEYQDSNALQEDLVGLICRKDPYNVYRIGDVKQSIYRFRGAKPGLMRSYIQNENEANLTVRYKKNFRSTPTIIEFNNRVFRHIMNIDGYEDTYTDENDRVTYGTDFQKENDSPVEIHLIEGSDYSRNETAVFKDHLAGLITDRILEMRKTSPFKNWKDYVILVRTHAYKTVLENRLKQAGIPYFFETKVGYYSDEAVTAVLSWLRWIDHPDDEISMFGVLSSAYYRRDDEYFAYLRKMRIAKESYYQVLKAEQNPIIKDYENLSDLYRKDGLGALVKAVFSLKDFYYTKTTLQQRDNLDRFYEYVMEAEKDCLSLERFLHRIDIDASKDQGSATSISSSADVVRITTIHASKGLQYKVVLCMSDILAGKNGEKGSAITDEQLGLAYNYTELPYRNRSKTLLWKMISDKHHALDTEEAIRLLYVAWTRPEKKLLIFGMKDESPAAKASFTSSYLESNSAGMFTVGNLLREALRFEDPSLYTVTNHTRAELEALEWDKIRRTVLRGASREVYSREKIPVKTFTPSSTEHHYLPPLKDRKGSSAAIRGSALHLALEKIDFGDASADGFRKLGLGLSEDDIAKLGKFFEQPLFEEIRQGEIRKEYPFAVRKDGILVHGIIDLAVFFEDKIILVDYKSDRRVTPEILKERYTSQIHEYRKALNTFGLPVEAYLYSIDLERFVPIPESGDSSNEHNDL